MRSPNHGSSNPLKHPSAVPSNRARTGDFNQVRFNFVFYSWKRLCKVLYVVIKSFHAMHDLFNYFILSFLFKINRKISNLDAKCCLVLIKPQARRCGGNPFSIICCSLLRHICTYRFSLRSVLFSLLLHRTVARTTIRPRWSKKNQLRTARFFPGLRIACVLSARKPSVPAPLRATCSDTSTPTSAKTRWIKAAPTPL